MNIERTFLRGVSLEIPEGAKVFLESGQPELTLNVNAQVAHLQGEHYEVVLRATLTSKFGEKTHFLLEVEQGGIFRVDPMPEDHLAHVLEAFCPTILLPYLRVQIADILLRANLPVFQLPDINWVAMREQRLQAIAQAVAEKPAVLN